MEHIKNQTALYCPDLQVSTIKEAQGQERPIVVVSLTRSSFEDEDTKHDDDLISLGGLKEPILVEKMMSGAMKLLILVGNDLHFRGGGVDFWHTLLEHVEFAEISF